MPLYGVLIYAADSAHDPDATPEDLQEPNAHAEELAASGSIRAGYAFTPRAHAISVRADGRAQGTFIESPAVVAGFYVIEAADPQAAADIAATNPAVSGIGGVEVRPIHSGGVFDGPTATSTDASA